LPWASIASDSTGLQERKYNGKEFVEMHGYDTYDYGARGYYAAIGRFQTVDPLAEKYYSISPYAYCAGNPVNRIDPDGLQIQATADAIAAIFYALKDGQNVKMDVKDGFIQAESIKDQAATSDDIVLKDLYEIAKDDKIVEMSVAKNYDYKDENNKIQNTDKDDGQRKFGQIYDANTNENPKVESVLKAQGKPTGKYVSGNTGRTLVPNSSTGASSTDNNIQVIINANGTIAQRAIGAAHEFGHVVLYLRGGPNGNYKHGQPGVDSEINKRVDQVSKRLGYDL